MGCVGSEDGQDPGERVVVVDVEVEEPGTLGDYIAKVRGSRRSTPSHA